MGEVEAYVIVPDFATGGPRTRQGAVLLTELSDGAWCAELNPSEGSCERLLYLPLGSTAGDAIAGILGLVPFLAA